jgi:peptide/nickel transport system substrate-binding protein
VLFAPTSPLRGQRPGMEALGAPRSLAQVQRDLITAGYDGESFVFLVPTDLAAVSAISDVAAEVLCKLGMTWTTRSWIGLRSPNG